MTVHRVCAAMRRVGLCAGLSGNRAKATCNLRARITTGYDTSRIDMGASIASDGVCLTVVGLGPDWYEVQISAETVDKTNLGQGGWYVGKRLNLERALKVGDELGGHIVSGHVDGVAEVIAMQDEGDSTRVTLRAPADLARFVAPKGSVALNGTSLTVNAVEWRDWRRCRDDAEPRRHRA